MTVTQKMLLLVASALIGLATLAGFNQYQMNRVYDAANFANINSLPSLLTLDAAYSDLTQVRISLYQAIVNTDRAKAEDIERTMTTARARIDQSLKKYEESYLADNTDRDLLDTDRKSLADYDDLRAKVLDLLKTQRTNEVVTLIMANQAILARVNDAFQAHREYNADIGTKGAQTAADIRSNASTLSWVITSLTLLAIASIGFVITRNLLRQLGGEPALAADIATKIAAGDLSTVIELRANDSTSLMAAMQRMSASIQALVADATVLSQAAVEGRLATRADASKHQGDYRRIVQGVNDTLDAVIGPLNVAADYVDRIAKGAIPPKITDNYRGDFNTLKNNLNLAIDNVNALIADALMLAQAARDLKLDTRADASKHQGDYRRIVQGVNDTLDAVINPVNELVAEMTRMAKEHEAGDIDVRVPAERFQSIFKAVAENVNKMVFDHIDVNKRAIGVFREFGAGNMDAYMEQLPGKKRFINEAIEQVRSNIKALIEDANLLSQAAVAGQLAVRADASRHLGDFRKIVEGMNATLAAIAEPVEHIRVTMARMAQGDLTATVDGHYQGTFLELKEAINDTVAKLSTTLAEVRSVANSITSASEQVNATAQSLSQASSEQAASVEETSSAMEQMAASINQNKDNAKATDSIAEKAAHEATEGGSAVTQTVQAMKQIAGKIGIIDDIAYQTNLLALNAAIEAARAGEHGKGFAVVAAEVRKLAERSQVAAQEIGELAESSVELAEHAGQLLGEIVPSIQKTAGLVQEISAGSEEQASGAAQISEAMNQLSKTTQQNASASEELSATSEEMSGQAMELQRSLGFFKITESEEGRKLSPHAATKTFRNSPKTFGNRAINEHGFAQF